MLNLTSTNTEHSNVILTNWKRKQKFLKINLRILIGKHKSKINEWSFKRRYWTHSPRNQSSKYFNFLVIGTK